MLTGLKPKKKTNFQVESETKKVWVGNPTFNNDTFKKNTSFLQIQSLVPKFENWAFFFEKYFPKFLWVSQNL